MSANYIKIKILTHLHTLPNVTSVNTVFFENLLEELRKKAQVHMVWLVYQPERLRRPLLENPDTTILDIHDFKNAIEVIRKEKPDVIYADAYWGFIDYALSIAGKFFNIPVVSGFYSYLDIKKRTKSELVKSYATRFFESSVPTDTSQNKKQFMKRGKFFIYKYLFLVKTQEASKLGMLRILKDFFILMKLYLGETKFILDSKFANTLHWLESEKLIEPLVEAGFDKEKLVVTGSPIFDKAFQTIKNWQPKPIGDKIHVLLVTTSFYEHGFWTKQQRDNIVGEVVKELLKNKKINLTVKIHPSSEVLYEYQLIINTIDPSVQIHQHGDILDFLKKADVIVSFASGNASAITYALIARKPIIIYNLYNLEHDLFLDRKLALECKNTSELIPQIFEIVRNNPATNEKIDDYVKEFLYKSDGLASRRIANLITKLIKK